MTRHSTSPTTDSLLSILELASCRSFRPPSIDPHHRRMRTVLYCGRATDASSSRSRHLPTIRYPPLAKLFSTVTAAQSKSTSAGARMRGTSRQLSQSVAAVVIIAFVPTMLAFKYRDLFGAFGESELFGSKRPPWHFRLAGHPFSNRYHLNLVANNSNLEVKPITRWILQATSHANSTK